MVDVLKSLDDLGCLNNGSESELKELLLDEFNDYVSDRGIEFTWLSDRHIQVDDDNEEVIESEIDEFLQGVYEDYIDSLIEDDEDE